MKFNLNISKCFGQEYDGATDMSGQYNTNIQTLILSDFPNAVYINCYAYNLNFVILNVAQS